MFLNYETCYTATMAENTPGPQRPATASNVPVDLKAFPDRQDFPTVVHELGGSG